ncbi:UNVERIFIED_CONTAM: hypothetical protein Sindi_1832600 [Sesamum indicum]
MSESSRHEQEERILPRQEGRRLHLTNEEWQMIEIASRNVMVENERKMVTQAESERRRLIKKQRKVIANDHMEGTNRTRSNMRQTLETSLARKSLDITFSNIRMRAPRISRAEVESLGKQIEKLKQQIDDLMKRGDLVKQNRDSLPDLPKYDRSKDPQEHISAFELVMNLCRQTDSINVKLFVTTLTGKAQEWFTSLRVKFAFHFTSERRLKRSATYLITIQKRSDESLKSFIGRFNNETLEVQDLWIDMMKSILIHGLKKGLFASALAGDPPGDVEQLMYVAQKYIDEEINGNKDREWDRGRDRDRQI